MEEILQECKLAIKRILDSIYFIKEIKDKKLLF